MDTFNQIRFAHDWIVKNYSYGNVGTDSSYTFPGAFKSRTCVCEGYAKTFLTFMTCLGVPVDYVHNKKHGWNLVKLNGAWYHLDATYDDPTGSLESTTSKYPIYDYFLQSTSNLKQKSGAGAHAYAENEWQKATSTLYDNDGDKSGYSEDMPDGTGMCSSTFTPWMNGQPMADVG